MSMGSTISSAILAVALELMVGNFWLVANQFTRDITGFTDC